MTSSAPAIAVSPLPPGPKYRNPLRAFQEMRRDPLAYFRRAVDEYGDIGCIDMWPRKHVWVTRPEHHRAIFLKGAEEFQKGIAFERLKVIGGDGLFFSEGDTWRKNRKLMSRSFSFRSLQRIAFHITQGATDFVDRLETQVGKPGFDITPEMARVAMDIACRAFFGDDILDRAVSISNALWETADYADNAMNSLFPPPIWVPTKTNRKTRRALAVMYGAIDDLIADGRERGETDNVLGQLISAVGNGDMTATHLRDEMWTLLNAGHETTATTLGFAFAFLSQHPLALRRVEDEADSLCGRLPGVDDIDRLGFTRRVVQETLRLIPPAWSTSREAMGDSAIDGYRIPRGTIIQTLFYLTHRHPEFWDDPDTFDPDRFTAERSKDRPEEAFIPFGLGNRRCLGERFAMFEATIVLASFSQRLRFRLTPGFRLKPGLQGFGAIRPLTGIPMTVHRR